MVSDVLLDAHAWLHCRGQALWTPEELSPSSIRTDVENGQYVLALVSDEAVGVVRFTWEDRLFWPEVVPAEAGYIHKLAVRRSYGGGQVSGEIIEWVAARTMAAGRRLLRLDCDASRAKLRAVYERFGFMFHSEHTVGPYTVARYQKQLVGRAQVRA